MAEPASAITNNLSFPGQYWDAEAALNYNWHRHYDPGLGRYVETDPLGMGSGDRNTYVYAWDKPLRASDPWGLWGEDVHSGINNSRYGTYTWARQIGFTEAAAKRIALANDATDGGFASWMPMIGLQSRHFNQFQYAEYQDSRAYWADLEFRRAIEYFKKGECELALAHLGKGLHSVQDIFGHRDWNTGFMGWDPHPEWYDEWGDPRNRIASLQAEEATKNFLKDFMKLTHLGH